MIKHPVERRGADNTIEGAGKWEINQIGGDNLDPVAELRVQVLPGGS